MSRTMLRPAWRSCVWASLPAWLTPASLAQAAISPRSMVSFFSTATNLHQHNKTRHSSLTRHFTVMSRKRKASPDPSDERHCPPLPLDPWGRDLTPEARMVAGAWWEFRWKLDKIDDNDLCSESSTRLLVQAARLRREYTRLVAGWRRPDHTLQPNSQTYEPPMLEFVENWRPRSPAAPEIVHALQKSVRKYQELQQNLDRFSYSRGAQWPVPELVELERQRREYNRLLELWLNHGFVWEPRLPDETVILGAPEARPAVTGELPPDATISNTEESQQLDTELGERPTLCPEQEAVVRLAEQGENIFYTGSAGCGKSTVLHEIKRRLRAQGKVVKVVAPTGIVALAINGTTTWTFMGWSPSFDKKSLEDLYWMTESHNGNQLRKVNSLIIDEISMVENKFFERMDKVLRFVRNREDSPFGGIQLIVTGDFRQLPPVKPFQHCLKCGFELQYIDTNSNICNNRECDESLFRMEDQFAFSSDAWAKCNFKYVHLKTIHRQQDGGFKTLLEKCRTGVPFNDDEIDVLMNHESHTEGAVRLMSTRSEVKATNRKAFDKLPDRRFSYKCSDGRNIKNHHPRLQSKFPWMTSSGDPGHKIVDFGQDHRFEEHLELKKGMSVLLLVNLNLRKGLCNGSQGIIVDFESLHINDLKELLEDKGGPESTHGQAIEDFARRNYNSKKRKKIALPVVRFHNGIERTILPECQINELGDPAPYSRVWRAQIPLTAGYALTIHKAQGMTLERVILNLGKVFQDEQVYVALSRATTLEGLKIEGDSDALKRALEGNPEVGRFMQRTDWIEFE